jgi:hypothetical protein
LPGIFLIPAAMANGSTEHAHHDWLKKEYLQRAASSTSSDISDNMLVLLIHSKWGGVFPLFPPSR